jgi:hypothetical protein
LWRLWHMKFGAVFSGMGFFICAIFTLGLVSLARWTKHEFIDNQRR